MTTNESSIDIARPPEEVFAYATDPSRFAEWQPDVVSVDTGPASSGALTVGSRFTTTRNIGGSRRTMTQEITEISSPRRWAARGIDGPVRPSAAITIEPIDGGAGSHVTFALEFTGHGLGAPLVPMIRKMAASVAPQSYLNLKQLLEAGGDKPAG